MAITFPSKTNPTLRLVTGSALQYNQMDNNFSSASKAINELIDLATGSAFITEPNTFTQPQNFTELTASRALINNAYISASSLTVNGPVQYNSLLTLAGGITSPGPINAQSGVTGSLLGTASLANNLNSEVLYIDNNNKVQISGSTFVLGSLTVSGSNTFTNVGPTVLSGSLKQGLAHTLLTSGLFSHAEGYETTAASNYSHAEGYASVAAAQYSHAEGQETKTTGLGSHAEGSSTTSIGQWSHAEGELTTAIGRSSHVEGYQTTTTNSYSHAEGYATIANGQSSHVEGYQTISIGQYSHAEGEQSIAIGLASHAEGKQSTAIGDYSHAEGELTTAEGYGSYTHGFKTIAKATGQFVVGQENATTTDIGAFIVGTGVSGTGKNGLEIYDSSGTTIVKMPNLPTSATGLPTGALWKDTANGNVIKVV